MLHDMRNAAAVNLLARVLIGLQRATEALHLVEEFLQQGHRPVAAELLLLRAQMLAMLRRFPEAISAFSEAILADANNGIAELGLAMALGEDGQVGATEQAARRAIRKGADSPGARYVLGRALFDIGRLDEAEAAFREVLDRQVDHSAAHASLAELIWMRSGNVVDAVAALDAALLRAPELSSLRITKASLLQSAGKPDLALAELERGSNHSPRDPALHFAAAKAAISIQPARALDHARSGLALVPRDPAARGILAEALLATDQVKEVAAIASQLLEINPDDNHAIAVMATAWRLEGDARYPELFDYTSFVKAMLIDVPDGWTSLDDYRSKSAARVARPLD
jgi:Putative Zn-dependent protease, contains TPR repeats